MNNILIDKLLTAPEGYQARIEIRKWGRNWCVYRLPYYTDGDEPKRIGACGETLDEALDYLLKNINNESRNLEGHQGI